MERTRLLPIAQHGCCLVVVRMNKADVGLGSREAGAIASVWVGSRAKSINVPHHDSPKIGRRHSHPRRRAYHDKKDEQRSAAEHCQV